MVAAVASSRPLAPVWPRSGVHSRVASQSTEHAAQSTRGEGGGGAAGRLCLALGLSQNWGLCLGEEGR